MARRPGMVNGNHTNRDAAPPSTLAAQIVQNQSRPIASQKPGDEATFKDHLRDILDENSIQQETDVNVNAQLIHVVAQAGLSPLIANNPFSDLAAAADSLKVIDVTARRQPDVLFTSVVPNGPPLILGLLATVVALSGRPKAQDLPTSQLLQSLIDTLDASIDLWQHAQQVKDVLRDFATGEPCPFWCLASTDLSSKMQSSPWSPFSRQTCHHRWICLQHVAYHGCGSIPTMQSRCLKVLGLQ